LEEINGLIRWHYRQVLLKKHSEEITMANGIVQPEGRSPLYPPKLKFEQPVFQYGASETYSENILGPVEFWMWDLHIVASVADPNLPEQVAPSNKAQIVELAETFKLKIRIRFNDTPLTRLLLCLGTKITVTFCAEGCGGKATEVDLQAMITTKKDEFYYEVEWVGTPNSAGMTEGFYGIAAVANIGPANHPCAQYLLGAGYCAGVLLQVYDA
jgi:hypothetical protein